MKAYKLEIVVIDHEDMMSIEDIEAELRYADIGARVIDSVEADIGEWSDDHPLNLRSTPIDIIREYFKNEN